MCLFDAVRLAPIPRMWFGDFCLDVVNAQPWSVSWIELRSGLWALRASE